jgi:hypothetical protein
VVYLLCAVFALPEMGLSHLAGTHGVLERSMADIPYSYAVAEQVLTAIQRPKGIQKATMLGLYKLRVVVEVAALPSLQRGVQKLSNLSQSPRCNKLPGLDM